LEERSISLSSCGDPRAKTCLKAQVGQQRVDVIAADSAAFESLLAVLQEDFDVTLLREQRTISIPAPGEARDLARVAGVVDASRIDVDEIALRRPTLDDAFLALTGNPAGAGEPEHEEAIA
jgi:hypothetical protein